MVEHRCQEYVPGCGRLCADGFRYRAAGGVDPVAGGIPGLQQRLHARGPAVRCFLQFDDFFCVYGGREPARALAI